MNDHTKKFRILCIDGGGMRALIPLQILKYIENRTGKKIHECFDLIAGTSTGGIVASAITLADKNSVYANTRKYSIEEIEDLYIQKGEKIFEKSKYKIFRFFQKKIRARFRPEFRPDNLDKVLNDYFGNSRIADSLTPIYITAFDIHRNIPIFFSTREASLFAEKNARIIDICRATSAAPTYFPSYSFSYNNENISCIDGGIFMNNPTLGAITEVLSNSQNKHYNLGLIKDLRSISVLSLGTGISDSLIDNNKAKDWGQFKWARPVIDLTMNSPIKALEHQMGVIYSLFGSDYNYLRINISISKKYSEMSDTNLENINYLKDQAESQVLNNTTMQLKLDLFLKEANLI